MKVLKFQKNKIYLEEDEIIDINRDIKAKYDIKKGRELSAEEYGEIIYDSALSKSYFLLSMRDYTKRDLFFKLRDKYKKSNRVTFQLNKVIERLVEQGYIDDYTYTQSYIYSKGSRGKNRIKYELSMKGIPSSVVDEVYSELREQGEDDEREKIRKQYSKVRKKERDKQISYFARRGFNLGDILEVLKEMEDEKNS